MTLNSTEQEPVRPNGPCPKCGYGGELKWLEDWEAPRRVSAWSRPNYKTKYSLKYSAALQESVYMEHGEHLEFICLSCGYKTFLQCLDAE